MKLKIKNNLIMAYIQFLQNAKLTGKPSRAKMKVLKKLDDKRQELAEDLQGLEEDEAQEILSEESIVDLTEYENRVPDLYDALENYPHDLQGADAVIHDNFLDALEDALSSRMQDNGTADGE